MSANLAQQTNEQKIERSSEFARMNGIEIDTTISKIAPTEETQVENEEIQVEEIVTTRPVAGHPLLKGLTVSGGVLLLVIVFGSMIGGLSQSLSNSNNIQEPVTTKTKEEDLNSEEDKGQLKTAIAITSQKGELAAIASKKSNSNPIPSASPSPSQPQTLPTATPTTNPPITVRREPPPPPQTTYQPRQRNATYNPQPTQSQPTQSQPTQRVPRTEPTVNSRSLVPSFSRDVQKDPMQEWLAAGNIGNYSAGDSSGNVNDTAFDEDSNKNLQVEGGSGRSATFQQTSTIPPNYDGKRILVGTRAGGVMETPIAWVGSGISSNQQQGQNSLIRLSQPLKAFDGSEVLPKGSYIVAILNPTNSEIAQMSAISALVNIDGKTIEKQLPANSILILGKDGNLLKAKSRKGGSNLGNSLMASLLSGLSKAAEIQNRALSETSISSNGVTTTSTSNSDKDLVAGFAEGSINEILSRMKTQNERQIQSVQQQQQQVFVIEAGKEVQIFVNQSIII